MKKILFASVASLLMAATAMAQATTPTAKNAATEKHAPGKEKSQHHKEMKEAEKATAKTNHAEKKEAKEEAKEQKNAAKASAKKAEKETPKEKKHK